MVGYPGKILAQQRNVSPTRNATSQPGTPGYSVVDNLSATTNPGATNDVSQGYQPGCLWINQNTGVVWTCTDNVAGAAVWASGSGGGGSGNVSNTGTPVAGQVAQWTDATTIEGVDTTGGGDYVKATSPSLISPDLGTPSAIKLTNATDFPATAVTAASYGDATHVGAFTVDAAGRLTAASSVAITGGSPSGSAGGDLGGTYPNPTVVSVANVSTGTLGVAHGGIGLSGGNTGGVLGFVATGQLASSAVLASNHVVVGGGPGLTPATIGSAGTAKQTLHGDAGSGPSWGLVNLGTEVTGTLPFANLTTLAASTLAGNPTGAGAAIQGVPLANLFFGSGTLFASVVISDGTTTVNPAIELDFVGATVANMGSGKAGITITGGGGGVTSVVAQGGPFLANGTISSAGTINSSITSLTASALLLGGGTGPVAPLGSLGTATTVLHGNAGGAPTFGAVSLSADVTGLLPFANLATLGAVTLFGNDGTVGATGSAIAVGANLTLAAGTLSATGGGGGSTTIIAGANLTGGTITTSGTLALSNSPSITGTMTAAGVSLTNGSVSSAPSAGSDIANKIYVDSVAAALNPAVAVQAATTQASDTSGLTYNNGVSGIGATLTGAVNTAVTWDGYTFTALGQRGLVKNDTQSPSGAFNGVYYVTQIQTAILPLILTRALDYDQPSDINNTGAIPVVNGTANGSTTWLITSQVTTVGTDPLTYAKFSLNPSTIVVGPASATDGHVAVFDGTTGKLIKDGGALATGNVSNTGTPVSGQAAEWTSATVVQGVPVTGSGIYVKNTSAALVTPALGTPTSGTLTNATGLPLAGIVNINTGIVGNSGTAAAAPSLIAIGSGLALTAGTLTASAGGVGTIIASGVTNTGTSQPLIAVPYLLPTFTTWFNQGSATATGVTNGPLQLLMPTIPSGSNVVARYKSLPGGAFTLVANMGLVGANQSTSSPSFGLILTDGTKVAAYQGSFIRANPQTLNLDLWTNATTVSGLGSGSNYNVNDTLWQRIVYDGSVTFTWSLSHDGVTWLQQFSTTITTLTFTPSGAGVGIESFASIASAYTGTLNYWSGV